MNDKVSIIIPSYNNGGQIIRLLDSIYNQDYKNIEVLIIDGKSSDNTIELIDHYPHKIDIVVHEPDKGIFDAMNKGIRLSSGDWLFFIGTDDSFYSNKSLSTLFDSMNFDEVEIIYGKIYDQHKKQTLGQPIHTKQELLQKQFWHQSMFYRKSVFDKVGYFNQEYKIAADTVLNLNAFCNFKFNWIYTDTIITCFSGDGLSSYAMDKKYHKDQVSLFENWFKGLSKKSIKTALQHHLYNEIKHGNLGKAFFEYVDLVWTTKKISPFTRNALYWLKHRVNKSNK